MRALTFSGHRTKKYIAAYEAQRFEFFIRSLLKKLRQRNELLGGNHNENDQRAVIFISQERENKLCKHFYYFMCIHPCAFTIRLHDEL